SFPNTYNFITPTNATGAKMYWAFGDHLDLNVYLVNQLFDCVIIGAACLSGPAGTGDSAVPSWGMRLGYNFGAENKKSTVGISYEGVPEQAGNNAQIDTIVDLDFAIKPTENWLIAGEAVYAQRDNLPTVLGPNAKSMGAYFVLDYKLSDIWDVDFSYGYFHDFQGLYSGADQQIHNFLIGAGY